MSTDSNGGTEHTPSSLSFVRSWALALACVSAVVGPTALLAAPMLIPLALGEEWWAFALMGVVYCLVVSFLAGLGTWLVHR